MGTQERLIRAARHYERAVHVLIRQTVKTVQNHMVNSCLEFSSTRPPIGNSRHIYFVSSTVDNFTCLGIWIEAECPARIDLSGGW